jgi:hypothetical protein
MTTRTTRTLVRFARPFRLAGIEDEQRPGDYEITTDEELIGGMTTHGWRRIATTILISGHGATRRYAIDPADLAASLARDASVPG